MRSISSQSDASYVRYTGRDGGGELFVSDASYGPGGRGARISYTIVDSPFGRLAVAAASRGVCWLGIHESDVYLASELRTDYPMAQIHRGDAGVRALAQQILDYTFGAAAELDLPLDIRATSFQLAVWRDLCAIPFGMTRSYVEIARRIGHPTAARAVGHANGSNPAAIVIPCHRAIGASGSLTGYRWGVAYKRRLLEHERALVQQSAALASFTRNSVARETKHPA
jgi:AraC family transcriptional regulator of adaptative response/methylated-DNA-[protein]-cysteine methyltransferase